MTPIIEMRPSGIRRARAGRTGGELAHARKLENIERGVGMLAEIAERLDCALTPTLDKWMDRESVQERWRIINELRKAGFSLREIGEILGITHIAAFHALRKLHGAD